MTEATSDGYCFVVGSGSSLLKLTDAERSFLDQHPRVLALNQFVRYWKKAGFRPTDCIMTDWVFPATYIAFEIMKSARELDRQPTVYLNEKYTKLFSLRPRRFMFSLRERRRLLEEHSFRVPLRKPYRNVVPFKVRNRSTRPFFWAKTLSEELFWYRGSLTTAINLANILWPNCHICLLGIDLNSNGHFFDGLESEWEQAMKNKASEVVKNRWKLVEKKKTHMTALPYLGVPGVPAVIPKIRHHLEASGNQLFCCNSESLLVTDDLCKYKPLESCIK